MNRYDYLRIKPKPPEPEFYQGSEYIDITFYKKPNGRQDTRSCNAVFEDDADYINRKGLIISAEEIRPEEYAIYIDDGQYTDEGEPDEIVVLSKGRDCASTIQEGVQRAKQRDRVKYQKRGFVT